MVFQNITIGLELIKRDSAFFRAVIMAIGAVLGENRLDILVKLRRA